MEKTTYFMHFAREKEDVKKESTESLLICIASRQSLWEQNQIFGVEVIDFTVIPEMRKRNLRSVRNSYLVRYIAMRPKFEKYNEYSMHEFLDLMPAELERRGFDIKGNPIPFATSAEDEPRSLKVMLKKWVYRLRQWYYGKYIEDKRGYNGPIDPRNVEFEKTLAMREEEDWKKES